MIAEAVYPLALYGHLHTGSRRTFLTGGAASSVRIELASTPAVQPSVDHVECSWAGSRFV